MEVVSGDQKIGLALACCLRDDSFYRRVGYLFDGSASR
jgi:hypothetical protein